MAIVHFTFKKDEIPAGAVNVQESKTQTTKYGTKIVINDIHPEGIECTDYDNPLGLHDVPYWTYESHNGLCLFEREMNGRDDSDFYMTIWDDSKGETFEYCFASTRGWSYPSYASYVDATPEVLAKYEALQEKRRKEAEIAANEARLNRVERGKDLVVLSGRKLKAGTIGRCFWRGVNKFKVPKYSRGYMQYIADRDDNVGIEYAMFHAQAAALRSAQLGRQVGAAIATEDGDIIAVGTNEVPKAGGGLYWEGDEHDRRDHVLGYDSSDAMKRRAFADILSKLRDSGWLASDKSDRDIETLVEEALKQTNIKGTQLMNTIEFMRAVHAEMAALINAATRGVSVKGCTLHATTFPCHDCAKHIVAAGISRVVYIEPYPKSLAADLYPDSVAVEGKGDPTRQVPFDPFVGIAPRKYIELFTMGKRKDGKGKKINWDGTTAVPKSLDYTLSFYPTREAFYYEKFQSDMIKAGLSS